MLKMFQRLLNFFFLILQNGKCCFNVVNVGVIDSGFIDIKSKSELDF